MNAVQVIKNSFYNECNSNRKDNSHLKNWVDCDFKGDETFESVGSKLWVKLSRIGDYINYILKLPQMNSLICVKNGKYQKGLMISLLMSLSCFEKLIEESDKSYVVAMENNKKGNIGSATDTQEDKYLLEAWKKTFYNVYGPKFQGMSNTTLIDQARYDFIVKSLQSISAYPSDHKLVLQEKKFKKNTLY